MNRLQYETSPYLLQHAHNPVDWYAWGEEALAKARREDKPILVSIGYSTCHWCHVMERESFEDDATAQMMNNYFVCIKIDREERPDLDGIYMEACQAMTGSGGWPLNCFLLPDGRPFYAGTYFPPVPAHGRASWKQVLESLAAAYQQKRALLEEQATKITGYIGQNTSSKNNLVATEQSLWSFADWENAYYKLRERFDRAEGGFGGAPKFPGTMSLEFLLQYYYHNNNKEAIEHLNLSLRKMIFGGIYDVLGGGFSRYSVDREWHIPHFEKMLYDNALLVSILSKTYQVTKDELYKKTIEDTLTYIQREMRSAEGLFYAAQDADSEGIEGKFFAWKTPSATAEASDLMHIPQALWDKTYPALGKGPVGELFAAYYNLTPEGNWLAHAPFEGANVFLCDQTETEFAQKLGFEASVLQAAFAEIREALFAIREQRVHPSTDTKLLLDWNALMITAYAHAAEALQNEHYQQIAVDTLNAALKTFANLETGELRHTIKQAGFLDDYANCIQACLAVYALTFDTQYLAYAKLFTATAIEKFYDDSDGLFFFAAAEQIDLIVRKKEFYDNATPSGNSTMLHNLLDLAIIYDANDYREKATRIAQSMRDAAGYYPNAFARWSQALASSVNGSVEIAVIGKDYKRIAQELKQYYRAPQSIIMGAPYSVAEMPLLANRTVPADETWIFVCKNYTCQLPVKTVAEAIKQIQPFN